MVVAVAVAVAIVVVVVVAVAVAIVVVVVVAVVVVVVVVAFFLFRAISGCFQLAQAIHPLLPRRGRKSLGRGPGRSPSVAKPREMLRPAWRVGWGRLGGGLRLGLGGLVRLLDDMMLCRL